MLEEKKAIIDSKEYNNEFKIKWISNRFQFMKNKIILYNL